MNESELNSTSSELVLPTLGEKLLDAAALAELFQDLKDCTEVISVLLKAQSQQLVSDQQITLEQAHCLLKEGNVRAVQIRYRYDASEWCDTIFPIQQHYRVIRIQS